MAIINHDTREVQFKLVYCGTPLGGKTTNLSYVHARLQGDQRGDLVSLATSNDRTVFFDFLPVDCDSIHGYRTKFQLYTVPGQVVYNATRQLVLKGADGVVFVADSATGRLEENVASFQGMRANLSENGMRWGEMPVVLQYNKRDLPDAAPLRYLEYLFNREAPRLPVFEAVATRGHNVFATLNALSQIVLHRFHEGLDPDAREVEPALEVPGEPAGCGV